MNDKLTLFFHYIILFIEMFLPISKLRLYSLLIVNSLSLKTLGLVAYFWDFPRFISKTHGSLLLLDHAVIYLSHISEVALCCFLYFIKLYHYDPLLKFVLLCIQSKACPSAFTPIINLSLY